MDNAKMQKMQLFKKGTHESTEKVTAVYKMVKRKTVKRCTASGRLFVGLRAE